MRRGGSQVNNRVLLGIVATLALAVPIPAFAQAAAESALTNALSSSATAKAGSVLSHSLNQTSSQLGNRIQQRTAGPLQGGTQRPAPRAGAKTSTTEVLAAGSAHPVSSRTMGGISVQGGEIACPTNAPNSQGPSAKTTPSVDCHRSAPAAISGTNADTYKSFVMLPAPK